MMTQHFFLILTKIQKWFTLKLKKMPWAEEGNLRKAISKKVKVWEILHFKKKNLNINLSDKDRFKNRMKLLRLFFCATSPFFLSRKNFTFTVKQNFD